MFLIVGLGNPGKQYDGTRHNIGRQIIEQCRQDETIKEKFQGLYFIRHTANQKIMFLMPNNFMNNSGLVISQFVNYYQIDISQVLIVFDDKDLPFPTIRLRKAGSSGGHNGIKSIIAALGTTTFSRIKIGVNNDYNVDTKNFVLSRFSQEEAQSVPTVITKTIEIIEDFCEYDDMTKVMNK